MNGLFSFWKGDLSKALMGLGDPNRAANNHKYVIYLLSIRIYQKRLIYDNHLYIFIKSYVIIVGSVGIDIFLVGWWTWTCSVLQYADMQRSTLVSPVGGAMS